MQEKAIQNFLDIPNPPLLHELSLDYNKLADNSMNFSNLVENFEEIKDESSISDLFSSRHMQNDPFFSHYNDQSTVEMTYMKPLRNNEDLNNTKKRLNSVIEEVEEEDLSNFTNNKNSIFPKEFNIKKITMEKFRTIEFKRAVESKKTFMRCSTEKLSFRYNMSPSVANNAFIVKPDIKIQGVNFADKSPKNNEWLQKRERSSFRGLPGLIIKNHLKFLKVNSNIQISIFPIIKSIVYVIIDALQAILSLFSCVLYILDCYVSPDNITTLDFLHTAELVITIIFTIDLLRHFYEAKDKIHFFLKIHTLIDIIAIAPYYISQLLPLENSLNFLHILQIFRLIRILRLYRLFKDPDHENSDQINEVRFSLEKQLGILVCTIFATLFIFSGISFELNAIFLETYLIEITDNNGSYYTTQTDDYTFFYAFYLLFQTFLSIGYGDVTPCEVSSRLFICVAIIIFSLLLIDQVYKLWDIKSKISPYDFDYKRTEHYIIIGYFTENSIQRMLADLFKEENLVDNDRSILLVRNLPPSPEMINLVEKFNSQLNETVISYLQCSFMKEDILTKANVKYSKAIFIMNDPNLKANDNEILMLLTLFQDSNAFIRKIVQLNNNRHDLWKESPLSNPWNFPFSPKRLKTSLIVGSAFNKGLITLFNNLMLNSSLFIPQVKTSLECQWLMEYSASSMQSIYLVSLSPHFIGKKFNELVKIIYNARSKLDAVEGTLIIGIKNFKKIEQNKGNIYLNPQNYSIKAEDQAIVLAKSKETADFLSFYLEEAEFKQQELRDSTNRESETDGIEFYSDLVKEYELKKSHETDYFCEKMKKHVLLWKSDITTRLKGHILVFAEEEDLELILSEIRKRTEKPVCFFMEKSPSVRILETLAQNPLAFILEGNILNLEHLKHANLGQAFHVLIFTQATEDISNNLDSKAILLSNILEEFFSVPYTMEISDLSELKLLGFSAKKEFANLGLHFNPHFMAGNVLPSNIVDSLSVYLLENDILLEILKHSFHGEKSRADLFENKKIFSINCPLAYIGRKYEDFLLKCLNLKNSVIPLGILTRKFTKIDNQQFRLLRELQNKNLRQSQLFNTNSPGTNNSPTKRLNQLYNDDRDPRSLKLPLFLINPLPSTVMNKGDIFLIIGEITRENFSMQEFPLNSMRFLDEDFKAIKEKNTEKFKEIVECLKEKMLNKEAVEDLSMQKNEMIDNLEKMIEDKRTMLKKMNLNTWTGF